MARTTGFAVGKLCEAQAKLAEAAQLVTKARLDTIRLSGDGPDEFRGTELDRQLDKLGGDLMEKTYSIEPLVRDLAALIEAGLGATGPLDTEAQREAAGLTLLTPDSNGSGYGQCP